MLEPRSSLKQRFHKGFQKQELTMQNSFQVSLKSVLEMIHCWLKRLIDIRTNSEGRKRGLRRAAWCWGCAFFVLKCRHFSKDGGVKWKDVQLRKLDGNDPNVVVVRSKKHISIISCQCRVMDSVKSKGQVPAE